MSTVTKCLCEECKYNERHNCQADSIEVRSMGDKRVDTSDGTCCNTFKCRDDSYNCK